MKLVFKIVLVFLSISFKHCIEQPYYYPPAYYNGNPGSGMYIPPTTYSSPSGTETVHGTVYPNYPVPYGTGYYYSDNAPTFTVRADRKNVIAWEKEEFIHKFDEVFKEIKTLKQELFGNSDTDMTKYRNKKPYYDANWIARAKKISKILELEELLKFYEKNSSEANRQSTKRTESSSNLRKNQ